MKADSPIGIFDSGIGGFTVLSEVSSLMPHEDIIYFGDTARVPYGPKSQDTVVRYSEEILDFLLENRVKCVVIACNTASSYALDTLRRKTDTPIIGVVEPGVDALIREVHPNGHKQEQQTAALIATRGTVKSGTYEKFLRLKKQDIKLHAKACPLFVPLVEEGLIDHKITQEAACLYLDEFHQKNISNIILGCTHYPLLKKTIQGLYPNFNLIDSSQETAKALKSELIRRNIMAAKKQPGEIKIYVSDMIQTLKERQSLFLGTKDYQIRKVNLEK